MFAVFRKTVEVGTLCFSPKSMRSNILHRQLKIHVNTYKKCTNISVRRKKKHVFFSTHSTVWIFFSFFLFFFKSRIWASEETRLSISQLLWWSKEATPALNGFSEIIAPLPSLFLFKTTWHASPGATLVCIHILVIVKKTQRSIVLHKYCFNIEGPDGDEKRKVLFVSSISSRASTVCLQLPPYPLLYSLGCTPYWCRKFGALSVWRATFQMSALQAAQKCILMVWILEMFWGLFGFLYKVLTLSSHHRSAGKKTVF